VTDTVHTTFSLHDEDVEPLIVNPGSFFYLWCCDCRLRHIVFVDTEKSGAI